MLADVLVIELKTTTVHNMRANACLLAFIAFISCVLASDTLVVRLGQVAPVTVDASTGAEAGNHCDKHRHGAELAVKLINELNGGKGFKVGYGKDPLH